VSLGFLIPAGVLVGIVQSSFFEWAFHRYWLHRPWLPEGCFTAHTLVHHQLCKHDDTFHVVDEEQHEALSFQWWAGPLLAALNGLPWIALGLLLSAAGVALPWVAVSVTVMATVFVYYLGYEGFHLLMHRPSLPWVERAGWFQFLKRHHRLHHVHMHKNLNVLLPLADWALGTLVLEGAVPATTHPKARALARQHSAFGRRLRRGSPR
jgi:hypothetical protein